MGEGKRGDNRAVEGAKKKKKKTYLAGEKVKRKGERSATCAGRGSLRWYRAARALRT